MYYIPFRFIGESRLTLQIRYYFINLRYINPNSNIVMNRFATSFLAMFLMAGSVSLEAETFSNPILTGMNPDPSICRVGDDFYLVTSTFEYYPGLPIYHSKDLVNWHIIGHALSTHQSNPLKGAGTSGGQYAPTLRYHDGTFYIIGTNYGGEGSRGISIVTAKDPAGPWSDPVWLDQWWVDPSLDFYDGKTYYLSPDNAGSFLLGTIDVTTGKEIEPRRKVASGLGGSSPEGPHFYKIGEYYYIMSAEGGTGYEHREVIQRSKNPYGPYEPSPINPVLSNMNVPEHPFQAIGHADLVQLPDSSWWAVCLGIRPSKDKFQHMGRETFLAPVTWTDGWPKVGTDGVVAEQYERPPLPWHPWEKDPERDDFNKDKLNLYWNFLRNPYDKDWSLTARKGYLRLNGSALSLKQNDSPAFVGRRQTALNLEASAKMDFSPVSDNEEAGLIIRGNDKNHYDFLVTKRDGHKVAMLRQYLNDEEASTDYLELPEGEVVLSIVAGPDEYEFWVKDQDGKSPRLVGKAATRNLANEVIYGFTGVYIGMYASGNGKANTNPADFDWFDFIEKP